LDCRHDICTRNGIEFQTVEMEFDDRSHAVEWIIKNQFGRRNLLPYIRTKLALRLEETIAARATEKEKERKTTFQKSEKSNLPPINATKELAAIAGVSHDTVAKVKKIEAFATDQVKAKLASGEVSINEAFQDGECLLGVGFGYFEGVLGEGFKSKYIFRLAVPLPKLA
jgi:hypothetical protein